MKKVYSFMAALLFVCYLGLHNGYLALWNTSAPQPAHVFPYPAHLFTEQDQAALRRGIPITSEKELNKLLEDYLS